MPLKDRRSSFEREGVTGFPQCGWMIEFKLSGVSFLVTIGFLFRGALAEARTSLMASALSLGLCPELGLELEAGSWFTRSERREISSF